MYLCVRSRETNKNGRLCLRTALNYPDLDLSYMFV